MKEKLPTRQISRSLQTRPFLSLRHAMDRLFDDWFSEEEWTPLSIMEGKNGMFLPKIDVAENDKEIHISAELPGMEQKDVKLSVTEDTVTLKGEKKEEKEEKGEDFYRKERSFGSFYREIPLVCEVDKNKVSAHFKNGVLKINLPKVTETKPSAKVVDIKVE